MKQMDLIRLMEECGEVIQAASKMLRFGKHGSYCDGRTNRDVLIQEIGDLFACVDKLEIDPYSVAIAREKKHKKLEEIHKYELGLDCNLTRQQREDLHVTRGGNDGEYPHRNTRLYHPRRYGTRY